MLDERKRIRRHRQAVARKQAENKAFWIDVAAVLAIFDYQRSNYIRYSLYNFIRT